MLPLPGVLLPTPPLPPLSLLLPRLVASLLLLLLPPLPLLLLLLIVEGVCCPLPPPGVGSLDGPTDGGLGRRTPGSRIPLLLLVVSKFPFTARLSRLRLALFSKFTIDAPAAEGVAAVWARGTP